METHDFVIFVIYIFCKLSLGISFPSPSLSYSFPEYYSWHDFTPMNLFASICGVTINIQTNAWCTVTSPLQCFLVYNVVIEIVRI